MQEYQERLRKNILKRMEETGSTIDSIATGAKIQPSTLWRLLNKKCDPKLSTIAAIAAHLGADLEDLFHRPTVGESPLPL